MQVNLLVRYLLCCLVPIVLKNVASWEISGSYEKLQFRNQDFIQFPHMRRSIDSLPMLGCGAWTENLRCMVERNGLRLRGGEAAVDESSARPTIPGSTKTPVTTSSNLTELFVLAMDLGGQHCVGSIRLNREPPILVQNDISNLETPTAVAFRDGRIAIGASAADQPATNAANTIHDYLTHLGLPAPAMTGYNVPSAAGYSRVIRFSVRKPLK